MRLTTFLALAQKYQNLGWAMQQQLINVAKGAPLDQQNPSALRAIREFLDQISAHVEEADSLRYEIDDYLDPEGVTYAKVTTCPDRGVRDHR